MCFSPFYEPKSAEEQVLKSILLRVVNLIYDQAAIMTGNDRRMLLKAATTIS